MEQNNLPTLVFTADEVKQIERDYARVHNGHCFDLMQKAGAAVFETILKECNPLREVWIFCGKGNNGGDGYIVAKLLLEHAIPHRVFATGVPHEGSEASVAYEMYAKFGGSIEYELPNSGQFTNENSVISFSKPDVVVDALLGTGIERAPEGIIAKWIKYINLLKAYKVSVDIPSGVDADTRCVPDVCVKADKTVCMLALKPGLFTGAADEFVGDIEFASLGVDISNYENILNFNNPRYLLPIVKLSYEDIKEELPSRYKSFNKSDSGKVLIIAGRKGMGGAAIICGTSALRSGSGLVKLATDNFNVSAMLSVCPELMSLDLEDLDAVSKAVAWSDVIAIGPGLGVNEKTASLMALLDDDNDRAFVYDADALNVLAKYEQNYYKENRIITPHPGEAARLLGISIEEVNQDRLLSCYKLWQKYGGVVLLKGAGTVICDGQRLTIINEVAPALATGGSGDFLTGMIVSFLAQGLDLDMAAIAAACVHARAGKICGSKEGVLGCLPLDLCNYVRDLINAKC